MINIIRCYCAVFLPGEKESVSQWAAEVAFDSSDDTAFELFIEKIKTSLSLTKRCFEVGVEKFGVEIAIRNYQAAPGHKSGHVYSIDSQASWEISVPYLLKGERHLVGKLRIEIIFKRYRQVASWGSFISILVLCGKLDVRNLSQ